MNIRQATTEDLQSEWTVRRDGVNLDMPTFQREEINLSRKENEGKKKSKKGLFDKFKFKDGLDYPTFLRVKPD